MAIVKALVSVLSLAALSTAAPAHLHQRHKGVSTRYISARDSTAPYGVNGNSETTTLPGVAYAPYRADNGCKTAQQVQEDFNDLAGHYSLVRVYGTDCDQVANVHSAAKKVGIKKLFLGIWDINDVANEAQKIIDSVKGDWSMVSAVSVGNELVNSGAASPDQVIAAIKQARDILRAAGYEGPVITVDTFTAVAAHPELCQASDFCGINAHAFFDSTITADQAGSWLTNTVKSIQSAVPDKKIVVTESGWPYKGIPNGQAVPGSSQQLQALTSIKKAFASNIGDVVLFSAFNCPWKKADPATFDAEPYWGIDGRIAKSDM